MERMAYYYGMKPEEFWSATFREVNTFCVCRMANDNDRLRENIIVMDASTNKTIQSHPLNKHPKVESLTKTFKKLFE